jgi:peptidoglycan/LPS O-acetylase OafA/YrhL
MTQLKLSKNDSDYLDILRGMSILLVVLVHLGLSWVFPPYSEMVLFVVPLLFFVSGAVSFYSFHRSTNINKYLTKRLISISVPYFVIVIFSFAVTWAINFEIPSLNLYAIYQWITFNPVAVSDTMPFPLGQVWFLHVLVIITIISPLFFILAKFRGIFILLPIVISITFGLAQNFDNIGGYLSLDKHNFYQIVPNMGFYFFGACYYAYKHKFSNIIILMLLSISILVAIALGMFVNTSNAMSDHSYYPDLFYISSSFVAILSFLLFKPLIERIINKLSVIKTILNFISYHAYSIYMIHTLLIFWSEKYYGLKGVMGSPDLAALKIIFVILGTMLLSIPVSFVSKKITTQMRALSVAK